LPVELSEIIKQKHIVEKLVGSIIAAVISASASLKNDLRRMRDSTPDDRRAVLFAKYGKN